MDIPIEFDRKEDGRWIADVPELPGVLVHGQTREEAQFKAERLANDVVRKKLRADG